MQQVSMSLLSHGRSMIQIQESPMIPDFFLSRQISPVCIFQSSLGTLRCTGFWISSCPRVRFPCRCFEYPRTFWRSRMGHKWRTYRESWCQIHRRRLRFCYNPVFFFLFLHPLRHRFGAAQSWNSERSSESWSDFCWISKEDFSIRHVKLPLDNMSASWWLMSMYLIWILESRLILSNHQCRVILWILDTCLLVGLLSFIIILSTASLSSKMYNKAFIREELTFDEIKSTLLRSRSACLVKFWFFMWGVVFREKFSCDSWSLVLLIWFGEEWNTSIAKCQRSSAYTWICIKRNNFSLCRAVWDWCLFLAHPTDRHNCSTSKKAQNFVWCWFWVF